ncbi:redoxin domain-containing protein [Aquibacillus halophilus]|uniref:Redoxin domain-containing protein n=1 Tax=Aquibacillus halophilus TaxID=930132 RepID=A0A6A8DJG6_9BACI|nr:redoxin domain-containing protein [Aquibacillus halophilus]
MVQLHENLNVLDDFDANAYIVSGDSPEEQLVVYDALKERYGVSLPFISDPELELIDKFNMKNEDAAYRGYGMLDADGEVVFNKVDDNWGDQLSATIEEINKEYKQLTNN